MGKLVYGISAVAMQTQVEIENDNNPAWIVRRTVFDSINNGGAAVGEARHFLQTEVADFSMLPGGAVITPPSTVFLTGWLIAGASPVSTTVRARIYYTIAELSTEDYWQLVEARRMIPQ
jgi:Trk-type K+ transport system membrane component